MLSPAIPRRSRQKESGYALLLLLLTVTVLVIAATAVLPTVAYNIRHDREDELIHRGSQYTRAIRAYYKKLGRYPTRLEDLENTNNMRFLRKRYKDPINGQDFKLLHYGDPGVKLGGSIGSTAIPGAVPAGTAADASGSTGSAFGGSSSAFGGGASGSAFGGGSNGPGGQSSAFGGNSNSAFGSNPGGQTPTEQQAANPGSGTDSSQAPQSPPRTGQGDTSAGAASQQFGGGPIVGVVSTVKKDGFHEFNKKKKYSEWQFVYDPSINMTGLPTVPNQTQIQGIGTQPGGLGTPAGQPTSGSAFGPSTPGTNAPSTPAPAPSPTSSEPPQ
jgi:type II secretory pathway pseudopilin PulG